MNGVKAEQLTKVYGKEKKIAVDSVSFTVNEGQIFGIIGPDGAGKTSIFRMLTTLLLPDGGHGYVNGLNVVTDYKAIRSTVGYMPGKFSLYPDLTVEENLNFFATVFNTTVEDNYSLIKDIYIQIEPFKKRRAGKLSGGMKQKLALCCALIHKPSVLFLDEPTTGVDPVSRKEFWEMLKKLKQAGITILVSTPYMDEAALCDRIALMQSGKILAINSPEGIIRSYPQKLYSSTVSNGYSLLKVINRWNTNVYGYSFGECIHVAAGNEIKIDQLSDYLQSQGYHNIRFNHIIPTVEDSFIQLLKN